ncbi:hypothetical protein VP489E541_P0062, partial [Vibrio phage 489E54-1]
MFIETKKAVERELKCLEKLGVPKHSIRMIECQIARAVDKRELGKTLKTAEGREKAYNRALNEIGFASNLCHFARHC